MSLIRLLIAEKSCNCAGVILDHEELPGALRDHFIGWVQQWRAPHGASVHRPPVASMLHLAYAGMQEGVP